MDRKEEQQKLKESVVNYLDKLILDIEDGKIEVVETSIEKIISQTYFNRVMDFYNLDSGFRKFTLTYLEK